MLVLHKGLEHFEYWGEELDLNYNKNTVLKQWYFDPWISFPSNGILEQELEAYIYLTYTFRQLPNCLLRVSKLLKACTMTSLDSYMAVREQSHSGGCKGAGKLMEISLLKVADFMLFALEKLYTSSSLGINSSKKMKSNQLIQLFM